MHVVANGINLQVLCVTASEIVKASLAQSEEVRQCHANNVMIHVAI